MPSKSRKHRSTMITVEQMVDIALGTPEIGAVNFNVLHALLHVIIQQLNIQKCLVEFKGHDSERMEGIIMTAKPGPILKVSEYMIDLIDGKPCKEANATPNPERPPAKTGKLLNTFLKNESKICDANVDPNEKGRPCDCSQENKEKVLRDDTEKTDTIQEKHDKSKEEEASESLPQSKKEELANRSGKGKKSDDAEPESDKDMKKLSKKERCKEKKLAKRKKREEEEAAASAEAEAREKSEAEQSEKGKRDCDTEDEAGGQKKKKKSCPCKAVEHKPESCPELKLKGTSSYYGSDSEGGCQTIVRVETIGERCDTWRSRPALAHESLAKLEEKVTLLQDAFETLEKMPTNEELMKRTTGSGCLPTPVKDMWQMYNLNKRVESCEGAIEKLASMIEDIVKETCNFREALMVIADAIDSMECQEETCANRGTSPCCGAPLGQPHRSQQSPPAEVKQEMIVFPVTSPNPCGTFTRAASMMKPDTEPQAAEVQVDGIPSPEERPEPNVPPSTGIGPDFFKLTTGEKFCALKETIDCIVCQLKTFTDLIPLDQLASKLCAIVTMQRELDNLRKEWEQFLQSFSDDGVNGAVGYIKGLNAEMVGVKDTIAKILEDRRQLELTIQSIQSEIGLLKMIKADKETMEDLLAEKADAAIVNRKVSHDQFDAACDDLTKGLDEALERLIAQEAMWNEAMEELQKDLENKLDKVEIMPLKEFINKKLKGLQEKLKQLAQLRKDAEAAGAKSRILRNLNCIACDNDVIMRMDNKGASQHPSLPPSRSMRPYISYELDQVRKALKKGSTCRGTNRVDEMMTEVQKKNIGLPLSREGVDSKINKFEHYCNRYCGGSHTITTPQQRVTRIGHFLTEFGPHTMLNHEMIPECKAVEGGGANVPVPQKDIRLV